MATAIPQLQKEIELLWHRIGAETPDDSGHYKGNEYTVIGTARHSETLEEHGVYRQEYGEHGMWVRP